MAHQKVGCRTIEGEIGTDCNARSTCGTKKRPYETAQVSGHILRLFYLSKTKISFKARIQVEAFTHDVQEAR